MKRFKRFYTDNGGKLFGYLLHKCGCRSLADDLVQETFTRYMERYRNHELSPALLFTMGRNLYYDHLRSRRAGVALTDNIEQKTFSSQEASYIFREESQKVLRCLQRLDDEERDILALVVSSELRYQEIAEIRGCSKANIKVKVHRARKRLKQLLQEDNDE